VVVADEPRTVTFSDLPAGVHKVTAKARAATHPPVSDYTYIAAPHY